jgi:fructokinase
MQSPHEQSGMSPSRPIVCAGEALIDLIADPADHWAEINGFVPRIGGAPANTSVAIKRLGGHAAFLGCLACDPPGEWIAGHLASEGVDCSHAEVVENAQTRLAVVTGPIEDRDFVFYGSPAADTLLSPKHVDRANLQHACAIMVGSLLLLNEPGKSAMHRLLQVAGDHDIPIVFDPNPRPRSWPDSEQARDLLLTFVQQASILKLGAGELDVIGMSVEQIRGEQPDDAVFVLTDGANGCWYWYGEERSRAVPSIRVDAVDSTGAGDAFTAALTLRYVERHGAIAYEDVRFASIAGALTTTQQGAMDALPDRTTVERYWHASG